MLHQQFSTMPLLSIMRPVLRSLIAAGLCLLLLASPSEAARDTDSYDGNIFCAVCREWVACSTCNNAERRFSERTHKCDRLLLGRQQH